MNMLYAFELSGKTKSMVIPTLIAALPVIPGGMIMIPRFLRQLSNDLKSQWTGMRLYNRNKETNRIQQMYGIERMR